MRFKVDSSELWTFCFSKNRFFIFLTLTELVIYFCRLGKIKFEKKTQSIICYWFRCNEQAVCKRKMIFLSLLTAFWMAAIVQLVKLWNHHPTSQFDCRCYEKKNGLLKMHTRTYTHIDILIKSITIDRVQPNVYIFEHDRLHHLTPQPSRMVDRTNRYGCDNKKGIKRIPCVHI